MREFFVGLLFLIAVFVMAGIGMLISPLLLVMVWFLRFLLIIALCLFAVWLLGKFIIYIFEKF